MTSTTPYEIVVLGEKDDPADCLRGLVQVLVEYTGKQITSCLDIISKEYGHSREDLADLLRNSKEFDLSLKKQLGLVVETSTKSGPLPVGESLPVGGSLSPFGGKKVVIKKKQLHPKDSGPSLKNSQ